MPKTNSLNLCQTLHSNYVSTALKYADDVIHGRIAACRFVKQACERQLHDLQHPPAGYHFDEKRANRVCAFIECLPHIKGRWSSPTITLQPFQCFRFTTAFGWVDSEGLRRFRTVYIEEPRKNAKSTEAAGVGLYLLCADDEPGAEVYSAATTRDQARIVWDIARHMALAAPGMRQAFGLQPLAHSIMIPARGASFRPLSRDADTLEGLNIHGAIIDELHAHKTREVFDVINSATGARRQPLIWIITTAGTNRAGVCFEQHNYIKAILERRHRDDRYFGIIYTLDQGDDWTSKHSWIKANPNFGISVFEDDIRTMCNQARTSAASQSNFLTKRLNLWVSVGNAYFDMMAWDESKQSDYTLDDFAGEECWISIDLATKIDIAAKIFLFPRGDEYYVFGKYYLPEDNLKPGSPNYDYYSGWARDNSVILTPGNVLDYEFIERDLQDDNRRFNIREVAFDPWQAMQLSTRMLACGLPMVETPMTLKRVSEPMKQTQALVLEHRIRHNGDPVLAWMMGNVISKTDANENVFPRKPRPEDKIDGAVALINAVGRSMADAGSSQPGVRWVGE